MENKLPLLLDSHYTCLIFPSVTMKFWSTQHVKITFWASLQNVKNLAASLDVLRNMISLKLLLFFFDLKPYIQCIYYMKYMCSDLPGTYRTTHFSNRVQTVGWMSKMVKLGTFIGMKKYSCAPCNNTDVNSILTQYWFSWNSVKLYSR